MEVNMRRKEFTNPYFQKEKSVRITQLPKTDYIYMKVWKEYYLRYADDQQFKGDPAYTLDKRIS